MTYLEKPRWIEDEDQDRPFPVVFRPTREEQETAEPVHFPGRDESMEYAADLPPGSDDADTSEDRAMIARPDSLLDEPEWGTAKTPAGDSERERIGPDNPGYGSLIFNPVFLCSSRLRERSA